jgi:hypothetical protein
MDHKGIQYQVVPKTGRLPTKDVGDNPITLNIVEPNHWSSARMQLGIRLCDCSILVAATIWLVAATIWATRLSRVSATATQPDGRSLNLEYSRTGSRVRHRCWSRCRSGRRARCRRKGRPARAFLWRVRVPLADPAAVLAESVFHQR